MLWSHAPRHGRFALCLLTALLMIALIGLSVGRGLTAAESIGLLAILQPAGDDTPAALKFYSPDAQLVHELPLPDGVAITARALSPDGLHFVNLTGAVSGPNEPRQSDLTLHILRTQDGAEVTAIPLLPPNFPDNIADNAALLLARDPTLNEYGDLEESVWQAFRFNLAAFEWSPDGKLLAFSAAIDGPSSDLYLYDVRDESVTRLTDGIEQVEGLRWSPDGQWIWHSTISYSYCQVCGGHHFAAAADGSRVVTLPGNDIYRFLGWVDDDSYLVTDQSNGPGDFALQLVDIPTGRSRMLWAGTHQGFVYDPAMNRLGLIGTRGQSYDPDEQVFVVDLVTGKETEYADLTTALESEPWLAPLDQRPLIEPCRTASPMIYPCVVTRYDPLSPNGAYRVTPTYAVVEVASSKQLLPPLPQLAERYVLWRPDSAGYFIPQVEKVAYRDLATGDLTWIEQANLVGWLSLANPADFATSTPSQSAPIPAPIPSSTPRPTAEIVLPYRSDTLVGSLPESAYALRVAHAQELATLAQKILADDSATGAAMRASGLPLLLAREAVATTFQPDPLLTPEPYVEPQAANALDVALASAPPQIATYPASGILPALHSLALSPDGSVVATGHSDGTVRLWDYEKGTLIRLLPSATTPITHLTFSSDGTMLAATAQSNVQMWHVDNGMRSTVHVGRYHNTMAVAWRPNSYDLAVANGSDPLMIHPRNEPAYPLLDTPVEAMAYSPDGTQLAVALQPLYPPLSAVSSRQFITPQERPIWIVDADTGARLQELSDDRTTYFMAYTPDGKTLVVGSSNLLRTWDIASGMLTFESTLPDFPNGWAITPDGAQIAILSQRAGVSFFDLSSGAHLRDLPIDAGLVGWLTIHPSDGQMISGEINGRPLLLDATTGIFNFRFDHPRERLIAISPGLSLFATADIRTITVRDLASDRVVYELADAAAFITDLAISPDGKWLTAREQQGHLLLWDLASGQLQWRKMPLDEQGGVVAFASDGYIVIGGSAGLLVLIDAADGSLLGQLPVGGEITDLTASSRNEAALIVGDFDAVALRVDLDSLLDDPQGDNAIIQTLDDPEVVNGQIAYSPDGSLLALARGIGATPTGTLEIWETATNRRVHNIVLEKQNAVNALAFSPDGQRIATGASYIPPITIWDVATGEQLQTVGGAKATTPSTRLAFTPDGTQLFATDENAVTTRFSLTPSYNLRTLTGHRGIVWEVELSPNGQYAMTAGEDHSIRVWDWQTGAQLYQFPEQPERVYSVSYSPSGDAVLVGGYDGQPRLYDNSGNLLATFPAHRSWIVDAVFRPDGNAFATAGQDGSVVAWNRIAAMPEWSVEGLPQGGGALAYSPDSKILVGSAGGGPNSAIYLWDAASGQEIRQLHGHDNYVIALAFSPDSRLLASASWDHTIKLWESATGNEVATLAGHTEILTDLTFSPDGTLLASVAEDYTLRLWDVATRKAIATIHMPRTLPWSVAFGTGGHALLTTHADGTLRTWLVDPNDSSTEAKLLIAAGRVPRATAEFTAQERQRYAIDTHIGIYPLSASANFNLRPEPFLQSLVVQPAPGNVPTGTLVALTNEKFVLTSTDQGESWRIMSRLPLTLTYASLGLPARADDPLLVATDKGLYRVAEDGALTLIHSDSFNGVSYSHTNLNELWAVGGDRQDRLGNQVYKSEDGGATWREASANMYSYKMFAPLLMMPPNDNPQLVAGNSQDSPVRLVWRGVANGFWERLVGLPPLPVGLTDEQGMAWDAGNRTLYLSGAQGELFASHNVDTPNAADVTAAAVEYFGPGTRPIPLAVGQGPTLYVNLLTPSGPKFLRGTWDGSKWSWVQLSLPIVAAG
jgi:WD40 repeat protein